jgi:predicted ABC-type ATPase
MKQLWILAGGNGAGKTTFYRLMLKPLGIPFINADQIAREIYPDDPEGNSYNAAKMAAQMCTEQIRAGNSFCFETVFSHPSKVDLLGRARALGYQIILVLIHLEHTDLNKARIANSQDACTGKEGYSAMRSGSDSGQFKKRQPIYSGCIYHRRSNDTSFSPPS